MLSGDVTVSSQGLATLLCRHVRAQVSAFPQNPGDGIWTRIVRLEL
jgi:hypothetical protein